VDELELGNKNKKGIKKTLDVEEESRVTDKLGKLSGKGVKKLLDW